MESAQLSNIKWSECKSYSTVLKSHAAQENFLHPVSTPPPPPPPITAFPPVNSSSTHPRPRGHTQAPVCPGPTASNTGLFHAVVRQTARTLQVLDTGRVGGAIRGGPFFVVVVVVFTLPIHKHVWDLERVERCEFALKSKTHWAWIQLQIPPPPKS